MPKKDDSFHMQDSSDFLTFYCEKFKDLENTFRCIMPKGFRTRSKAWYSKYLKLHKNHLVLNNPFFGHKSYEIIEIKEALEVIHTVNMPIQYSAYINKEVVHFDFNHPVKQVKNSEFERCLSKYKKGGKGC